jgi:hypothetical protein
MSHNDPNSLSPEMQRALPIIRDVFRQYAPPGFKVEYTACKEWLGHGMFSLHHSGNAVDIRTKTLPDAGIGTASQQIKTALQAALNTRFGSGKYAVLRNDAGPTRPHLHVQYNKGVRMSEPVDFDSNEPHRVA